MAQIWAKRKALDVGTPVATDQRQRRRQDSAGCDGDTTSPVLRSHRDC